MPNAKLAFMASLGYAQRPAAEVVASLKALGYDGFMSVEFESFTYYNTVLGGDVEEAARISKMQIDRLLDLWH